MPLLKRVVQPSYVSRVPLVQEWVRDEAGRVFPALLPATDPPQDLQAFTNLTLSNLITQLSSLSRHAEDLFGEMIADSTAIMNRTISLQGRVDKLAVKVKNLDSNVEEVSLQDIHMRKAFKSSTLFDQQVVSRDTVPAAMLETYTHCDHPPPLDQLNPYRDDGKDGLKFYTDPAYFFNLWREEMTKETEQLKDNKKKPGKPKGDGRKKNKIRQAANTRDKHKQLAIEKGEHIAENHYKAPPGQGSDDAEGKHMRRPNSIELTTSHQAPPPPSSHHQNDHPTYITNNSGHHLSPHHLQQQQLAGSNGAAGQMQGYGTAGNYPQSYLNQENFGIYGQTTYNPSAENGDSQGGTPNRVLQRVVSNRPSMPPPAPPSGSNTPTPPPSSHSGTPTRTSQQMGRDSLPPPPLPPAVGGAGEDVDGASIRPPDLLPPPPPIPSMHGGDIDLPPPSPPPPPPILPENGGPPTTNGPPPPPPPPPPMMNGAPPPPPMPNGDIKKQQRGDISSLSLSSVTLKPAPKKTRPVETDPRSDLLKAIRDGVSLTRPKEIDPRTDLLTAIRDGIKLRKVDAIKRGGSGSSSGGAGGRVPEDPSVDVASILQRRFAFEVSDSDTSSDTDSDSDDWDETSA